MLTTERLRSWVLRVVSVSSPAVPLPQSDFIAPARLSHDQAVKWYNARYAKVSAKSMEEPCISYLELQSIVNGERERLARIADVMADGYRIDGMSHSELACQILADRIRAR